ncbi:MAG: hypothetical protein J2P54_03250 [Bradyrhizobiaceae bacterium]|nr:hypothetical protein [Bradyrhizobiaceae bacterium]
MLKAGLALIAVLASSVGVAFWIESSAHPTKSPIPQLTMPSLEELHAQAHVDNLPVQEVTEPF